MERFGNPPSAGKALAVNVRSREIEAGSIGRNNLPVLTRILGGRLSYCVLHGFPPCAERPPSDLDIAVAPNDLENLERMLSSSRDLRVAQLFQHEATCYYFVLVSNQGDRMSFAALDTAVDYRLDGRVFFTANALLRHSRKVDGVPVAAQEVELGYLLVKKIMKGALPEYQKARIHDLFEVLGEDAHVVLRRMLGARYGNQAIGWLARSDWAAVESRLNQLRRAMRFEVIRQDPLNPVRYWGPEVFRRWRRWRWPTGLFVALLGPDGAGKSTLIEQLQANLSTKGAFRRASVFHMRARLHQRRAAHDSGTDPHGKASYPPWLSLLKVSYYGLTYFAGYVFLIRPRLVQSTLVLFDRYYDDLLVDPRRYRYGAAMVFARAARYLVRRPDVYFVLDVAEEHLIRRKQEVSREELTRQRSAYFQLAMESPNAVMLDGSLPAAQVARCAIDAIVDFLHERYVNRRRRWFGDDKSARTLAWLASILCSSPEDACFDFAPRWSTIKRYGWLSLGDGRAYLIPLQNTRMGRRALDLYNSQTAKASVAKGLVAAGLRLGVAGRLLRSVYLAAGDGSPTRDPAHRHILDHLRSVLGREDLDFGVSIGTPGPERKPVLLVVGGDGQAVAYVKIGSSDKSNILVQREVKALQFLAGRVGTSFSAPAVIHSGWWNGRYVVVQSAPKHQMRAVVGNQKLRSWDIPRELAAMRTCWMPLKESSVWADLQLRIGKVSSRYYRDVMERALRKVDVRLKADPLPFCFSHGDFTSWNMRSVGEQIYLFDWEHSRDDGLPAQDLIHFRFQEMACVQRRSVERIYADFLKDGILRRRIEGHLAGLGLTGVPLEIFFLLYRLEQLAKRAADIRAGMPVFREFAMFGKLLNVV